MTSASSAGIEEDSVAPLEARASVRDDSPAFSDFDIRPPIVAALAAVGIVKTFAIQALQDRLATGYGFAAFWGSSSIQNLPQGMEWAEYASHSHNGYLDTALAMGVPGLALLIVALVIAPLRDFHKAVQGGNGGPLATLLLQLWLFGLYLSTMESFFLDRADPMWFMFLLGVFGLHYLARFRLRE